jgi:hypothetical protein
LLVWTLADPALHLNLAANLLAANVLTASLLTTGLRKTAILVLLQRG